MPAKRARTNDNDEDDDEQVLLSPAAQAITNARINLDRTAEFFITFGDDTTQWLFRCQMAQYLDKLHSFLVSLPEPCFQLLNRCEYKLNSEMVGNALQQRRAVEQALEDGKKEEESVVMNTASIDDPEMIEISTVDSNLNKTFFESETSTTPWPVFRGFATHKNTEIMRLCLYSRGDDSKGTRRQPTLVLSMELRFGS